MCIFDLSLPQHWERSPKQTNKNKQDRNSYLNTKQTLTMQVEFDRFPSIAQFRPIKVTSYCFSLLNAPPMPYNENLIIKPKVHTMAYSAHDSWVGM